MSIQEQFAEAFIELRDEFGVAITFEGTPEVMAIVSESALSKDWAAGGFHNGADFVARVLLSDFVTVPAIGAMVTYKGKALKVGSVSIQPGHPVGEFAVVPRK